MALQETGWAPFTKICTGEGQSGTSCVTDWSHHKAQLIVQGPEN